jgi:lipopolysaccharide export system permease protein
VRVFNSIDLYIARKVFLPLVSTLVLAAMLLLLEKMLRLFQFVVSEGGPVSIVFRMLANLIPEYAGLAVPLSLMMGILLAFRNLALSSELDSMRAVGLGYGRLLRAPFVYMVLMIAANVSIVGFIQPYSEYNYQQLEFELRSGALGALIKVGEFSKFGPNITMRVEESENNGGVLHGVFVRFEDKDHHHIIATADSGQFMRTDSPNEIILRLTQGRLIQDQPGFSVPRVLSFTSQDLPIPLPAVEAFRGRGIGEEELTLPELVRVNADNSNPEEYRWKVRANFNFRLAEVMIMLFLPFLAVALAVPPKRSTSGLGMFVAVVFVVACHKIFQYGERTSAIGMGDPLVTIWAPFTVIILFILWMYWTLAHKPGGQPIGGLEWVVRRVIKWVARISGAERRKRKRAEAYSGS